MNIYFILQVNSLTVYKDVYQWLFIMMFIFYYGNTLL